MTHKDPQVRAEYQEKWRAKNSVRLKKYKQEYQRKHKKERAAYAKAYYAANKPRFVEASWKSRGYPVPTRPRPRHCELCGCPPGKKALHLDHCHATGVFRGWLCNLCNVGLGALGDTVAALQKASQYLKRGRA